MQPFATIFAVDADEGTNAALTYEIVNGNASSLLVLDRYTGLLHAGPYVDLMSVMNESFSLVVKVTDSVEPMSNYATAKLRVIITNDVLSDLNHGPPAVHSAVSGDLVSWLTDNAVILAAVGLAVLITVVTILVAAALLVRRRTKAKLDRLRARTRVELTEIATAARNEDELVGEESRLLMRVAEVLLVDMDSMPVKYGVSGHFLYY